MRTLVVGTFLTLDGVMQAPGAPEEDREGGFEHGGWTVRFWDDMMGEAIIAQLRAADALLLGRKTYQIFAAHWPRVTDPNDPIAAKLNGVRKHVVSRTLPTVDWNNSVLISRDVPETVARLKAGPGGEIQVAGSGNLVQTLLRHDLVDEFRLWVFPVVLGTGKRLFGDGTIPQALRLVETRVSGTGVATHRYVRAGKPEYGAFEVDEAGSSRALWEGNEESRGSSAGS